MVLAGRIIAPFSALAPFGTNPDSLGLTWDQRTGWEKRLALLRFNLEAVYTLCHASLDDFQFFGARLTRRPYVFPSRTVLSSRQLFPYGEGVSPFTSVVVTILPLLIGRLRTPISKGFLNAAYLSRIGRFQLCLLSLCFSFFAFGSCLAFVLYPSLAFLRVSVPPW